MVNVTETKKLTKLNFNGTEIVVNSEDTIIWNQITIETTEGNEFIVKEGDTIQFMIDSGEIKSGMVTKLSGKKENVEISIMPDDGHKESWKVSLIKEGTLKVIKNETEDEE